MTQINFGMALVFLFSTVVCGSIFALLYPLIRKEVGKSETKKVLQAQEKVKLLDLRRNEILAAAKVDELEHLRMQAAQARLDDANFRVHQLNPTKEAKNELVAAMTDCGKCGHPKEAHKHGECAYPCRCSRYRPPLEL